MDTPNHSFLGLQIDTPTGGSWYREFFSILCSFDVFDVFCSCKQIEVFLVQFVYFLDLETCVVH